MSLTDLLIIPRIDSCTYTVCNPPRMTSSIPPPSPVQFEYQQAQLEVEIENLSWKIERAESTDVADIRQQMNVTEVQRLTLLRDFVP